MFHSPLVLSDISSSWRYTGGGMEASFLCEHTTPTDPRSPAHVQKQTLQVFLPFGLYMFPFLQSAFLF